jgi:thioredoxin:protein disulfide reductase
MDCAPTSTGSPPKPLRPDPGFLRRRAVVVATVLLGLCPFALPAANVEPTVQLLPPEQAFRFSARALNDRTLEARFVIAEGYYLYRDKFKFAVTPEGAALGVPDLPAGKIKTDEFFGKMETYRGTLVVRLPLSGATAGQTIVLAADSQGCADAGVCYPSTRQKLTLALPAAGSGPGALVDATPPKKSWFK